jgi:tryptophan-rich sensory protein
MKTSNIIKFIISIFVCHVAGIFGSLFTFNALENWYVTLQRPEIAPPNYLFAPVWLILYTLMGISLYLIWTSKTKKADKKFAISVFGVQLALNALWSMFFFGLQSPLIAFIDIIALLIAIAITIFLFYKINKMASLILIPYIIWVAFAAVLNYLFWILNI